MSPAPLPAGPTPPVVEQFCGPAWVGGRERAVEHRIDARGDHWLEVEGGGGWWIDTGGTVARRRDRGPFADGLTEDDVALGPVLLLALALGGTFCFHASAVATPDGRGVVVFAGPSGVGKSTLAAAFGPRRLGDDVLPVSVVDGVAVVHPRFPQLKLDAAAQPGADAPERLPLAAVLLPVPYGVAGATGDDRVSFERLAARDAVAELVRHTLAGRLFPPGLLDRHLAFVADLAEGVPVGRLTVPWGTERLAQVTVEIDTSIGGDLR